MLLRLRSRGASALRCVLAMFALIGAARAHQVSPPAITLRPGGEDFIYVLDGGGCPAYIEARSSSPSLVQVYALDMNTQAVIAGNGTSASVGAAVAQTFLVVADPAITVAGSAFISICWVGDTSLGCFDDNCAPYAPFAVAISVDPDAITLGAQPYAGIVGDPISTDDGEVFLEEEPDFDLGGPMPLVFRRYYASKLASDGNTTGGLGPNWLHDFDWKLVSTGNNVEVTTSSGRVVRFQRGFFQSAWSLALYDDIPFQLVDSGPNRVLGDPTTGLARTFDSSGRLTKVEDGKGNAHTLGYAAGVLATIDDGLGGVLTLTRTAGLITGITDGTRNVVYAYTSGALTSATDAEGATTTYAYDAAHPGFALLTTRTRPEGNAPWTQIYDASKRATSQSDALANTTALAFNAAANRTTVTDPLGNQQVHDHSSDSELDDWQDEAGKSVKMTYDAQGRRRSVTDRLGDKTSWTYHGPSGLPASLTAADGALTNWSYTPRRFLGLTFYDLGSIAHADGTSESFARDATGNVTTWTDRAGAQWGYTYNNSGQVLTETNPTAGITTNAYNADATLASRADHAGNATTFGYDGLRRLTQITHPDAATAQFTYDNCNRVVTVQDEQMATSTFGRDTNGNVTSVVDGAGETWTLGYDWMDRLTGFTDPLGNTLSAAYDERGDVESVTNGASNTTQYGRDALGDLQWISDPLGFDSMFAHDAEGVLKSTTDPLAQATSFTSDVRGRTTRFTGALGHEFRLSYDALDRWSRFRDALGRFTDITYDARDDVASISEPLAGATTTYTRNALGQPTQIDDPGGASWLASFDAQGRQTSSTDPIGNQAAFAYDLRNRVSQVTLPGGIGSVGYTWNARNWLLQAAYTDGTVIDWNYDSVGRVTSTTDASFGYDIVGRMTSSNGLTNTFDAADRVTSILYTLGKLLTYTWDARGLPTGVTDWLGGTTTFSYDDAGSLIGMLRPNGIETRLTLDAEYRLSWLGDLDTNVVPPASLFDYSLGRNANGAITSLQRSGQLGTVPLNIRTFFTVDAAGQLAGYSYDTLGNLLGDGTSVFGWDLASRLRSYTKGSLSLQLDYDGFGLPRRIFNQGSTRDLLRNYSLPGAPAQILRDGGVDAQYVIHHPFGQPLYTIDAATSQRRFFHYDPSGSTAALSDDNAAITDQYELLPHGELLGWTGTSSNPFVFRAALGAYTLPGTDVTLIGGRPYVASLMRFANRDGAFAMRGGPITSLARTSFDLRSFRGHFFQGIDAKPPSRSSPYSFGFGDGDGRSRGIQLQGRYALSPEAPVQDNGFAAARFGDDESDEYDEEGWSSTRGISYVIRGGIDIDALRRQFGGLASPRGQHLPDNQRKAIKKFLALAPPARRHPAVRIGAPRGSLYTQLGGAPTRAFELNWYFDGSNFPRKAFALHERFSGGLDVGFAGQTGWFGDPWRIADLNPSYRGNYPREELSQ